MPNVIDENGLQTTGPVVDRETIIADYKDIYTVDINVEQNSRDGQQINILVQNTQDLKELLIGVYNSFDPDVAVGVNLDYRVAINNIVRKSGSYTITEIDVTVSQAINLEGLDGDPIGTGFTIADNSNTQFILLESQSIVGAGTFTFEFQSALIGQVQTIVNTITTPITILAGIVSVNNPSSALVTGENEESDAQLRLRRKQSVALNSVGFTSSLVANLLAVDEVQEVRVLENTTNFIDANGTEGHTFWAIVLGGDEIDIADTIFNIRSGGSGMRGLISIDVDDSQGNPLAVKFDRPINEDLYIRFSVKNVTGDPAIDSDFVREQIVLLQQYTIGETANATDLVCLVKDQILPNSFIQDMEVSNDNLTYVELLETTGVDFIFVLDVTRIFITILP